MDVSFDERLGAVSLFGGELWGSGTYTNLLTNPSFEATSGTVEVRRNYATDPRLKTAGGLDNNSNASVTRGAAGGVTITQAGTTGRGRFDVILSLPSGATGLWTLSFESGATVANQLGLWDNAWGGFASSWNLSGARKSITIDVTGKTSVRVGVYTQSTSVAIVDGSTAYIDKVLFEPASVVQPYFDGSFSPDSDLTAAWVGTANASASVLTGLSPTARQSNGPVVSFKSVIGRKYASSLRLVNASTSNDSNVFIAGSSGLTSMSGQSVTFEAGKTYTIQGWVKGTHSSGSTNNPKRIQGITNTVSGWTGATSSFSTTVRTEGDWRLERLILTVPSNAVTACIRIFNGGSVGMGDVWWTELILVKGALPAGVDYWDGANKPASIPGATNAWTGNPNASTSTLTIPAVNRVTIERDAGQGWQQIRGGNINTITGFYATTDNEMPHHSLVNYRVTGWNNNTRIRDFTQTVDTNVSHHNTYIKQAGNPTTTVQVPLTSGPDITSHTQGGTYNILGGNTIAVAAYTGTEADEFTLSARTASWLESARLHELLKTRILQFVPCEHPIYPTGYYYIRTVNKRLRADNTHLEGHEWTLNLVRTGTPSGDTARTTGLTWDQLAETGKTWNELLTEGTTWHELERG